jgi:hypothetical protein
MSEDLQDDFHRLLHEYRTQLPEGCEGLGKEVTLPDLRENIDHRLSFRPRNLGNIEQTWDAAGEELKAWMTIWTQLANALAPTPKARKSRRIPGSQKKSTSTDFEQVQDAVALGAAEGAAEARADEQHAQLLSLCISQFTLNYTPKRPRATPLMIGSTTPRHYCMLGIYAHNDTSLLGSFQIWWVPGVDNLFICGCHYPVGVALPDFVVDAVAARHMHAQAGAAEVRTGGGHDVPDHNNDPTARAASNSMSDNPAQGRGESGGGDDEDLTESEIDPENDPTRREFRDSPLPTPRSSESLDADENNAEAHRRSAGNSSSESSDADDVAGAHAIGERKKAAVENSAKADELQDAAEPHVLHGAGGRNGSAVDGPQQENVIDIDGVDDETQSDSDNEENPQAQRSSAGNSSSDWRALEQQVLAVEEALSALEWKTLNHVSELEHHREAQNSSANDDADSDEAGADVAEASRAGVAISGSLAEVLAKIGDLKSEELKLAKAELHMEKIRKKAAASKVVKSLMVNATNKNADPSRYGVVQDNRTLKSTPGAKQKKRKEEEEGKQRQAREQKDAEKVRAAVHTKITELIAHGIEFSKRTGRIGHEIEFSKRTLPHSANASKQGNEQHQNTRDAHEKSEQRRRHEQRRRQKDDKRQRSDARQRKQRQQEHEAEERNSDDDDSVLENHVLSEVLSDESSGVLSDESSGHSGVLSEEEFESWGHDGSVHHTHDLVTRARARNDLDHRPRTSMFFCAAARAAALSPPPHWQGETTPP